MKKETNIYILLIVLFFLSCKNNSTIKVNEEKNKAVLIDSVRNTKKQKQRDIYINKEYYEQEELIDVIILQFKETPIDSISYSLYKIRETEEYIFSLDRFLKNEDLAKYKTLDTVNLRSDKIEVKVEEFSDYKNLNLLLDKKLVKKWKFKTYSKTTKTISIINSWQKDNFEIHINSDNINYIFHGQCVYSFPAKIINDNEAELIWGYIGRDCVYEVQFDETFDLPKNKIPQKGKPFSRYIIEDNIVKVTYYYNEWLEKYRKKMKENDKPFPFLNFFSLKTE